MDDLKAQDPIQEDSWVGNCKVTTVAECVLVRRGKGGSRKESAGAGDVRRGPVLTSRNVWSGLQVTEAGRRGPSGGMVRWHRQAQQQEVLARVWTGWNSVQPASGEPQQWRAPEIGEKCHSQAEKVGRENHPWTRQASQICQKPGARGPQ